MTDSVLPWVIGVFLGCVLPACLVAIRQTVKRQRQEVIQDLASVFGETNPTAQSFPSFEFVKFKYHLPTRGDDTHGIRRSHDPSKDYALGSWLAAMSPMAIVVTPVAAFSATILLRAAITVVAGGGDAPMTAGAAAIAPPAIWEWAVTAAFFGAYLVAVRDLYRAIMNFDFSPTLILRTVLDIAIGVGVAVLVVGAAGSLVAGWPGMTQPAVLLAFVAGMLPDVARRAILAQSRLHNFKRDNPEIYKLVEVTPIEVIDGIDSDIRDRLADFHIVSTQNLATANPLMLFVETPYGIYQIMDWVAQAQLCASVGFPAMTRLWPLGVRTLFDLERAALGEHSRNSAVLQAIGAVMLGGTTGSGGPVPPAYKEDAIIANVQMRLDDPHVHRLRQIYIKVGECIGERHRRFATHADSAAPGQGMATPFAEGI